MLDDIFTRIYFGNSVLDYARATGAIFGGLIAFWLLKTIVLKRLQAWSKTTKTRFDDFILTAADRFLTPLVYLGIVYLGLSSLHLNPAVAKALNAMTSIAMTVAGIRLLQSAVQFAIFDIYVKKRSDAPTLNHRFQTLMPAFTVAIWVVGCVFLLDNLGFKVSAIMAGLGIGGVAVALAASTVLGDLFAYFVIMFDRPFVLGDFIILGDFMGAVEHIGIKTTRLRSLGGELLVFSNKDLTDSRLRNFQIMKTRRIEFHVGVTYDTSMELIKEIPEIIKRIITTIPETAFDRAHFASFGNYNLDIDVVYSVLSSDFNKYMDIQQAINIAIKEEFDKRGIKFAFPTQSLRIESPTVPQSVAVGAERN